jgi:hypothetical protein
MNTYNNNINRKVKSPEDWAVDIDKESTGKLGSWRILPREIFSSKAYRELSLSEREVLHCYLNKVTYVKPKGSEKRRMKSSKSYPINGDALIVTNHEIMARGGVTSDSTISKARKRLVEMGFLNVITPAAFPQSGVYGLSDRYKNYPNGDYRPKDDKPVSFSRYSRSCEIGSNRFTKVKDQPPSSIQISYRTGNLINSCKNCSGVELPIAV